MGKNAVYKILIIFMFVEGNALTFHFGCTLLCITLLPDHFNSNETKTFKTSNFHKTLTQFNKITMKKRSPIIFF